MPLKIILLSICLVVVAGIAITAFFFPLSEKEKKEMNTFQGNIVGSTDQLNGRYDINADQTSKYCDVQQVTEKLTAFVFKESGVYTVNVRTRINTRVNVDNKQIIARFNTLNQDFTTKSISSNTISVNAGVSACYFTRTYVIDVQKSEGFSYQLIASRSILSASFTPIETVVFSILKN